MAPFCGAKVLLSFWCGGGWVDVVLACLRVWYFSLSWDSPSSSIPHICHLPYYCLRRVFFFFPSDVLSALRFFVHVESFFSLARPPGRRECFLLRLFVLPLSIKFAVRFSVHGGPSFSLPRSRDGFILDRTIVEVFFPVFALAVHFFSCS